MVRGSVAGGCRAVSHRKAVKRFASRDAVPARDLRLPRSPREIHADVPGRHRGQSSAQAGAGPVPEEVRRRFMCSEAEYLTGLGIDLHLAARFDQRYSPAQVRVLVQAGVSPEQANAIHRSHALDIVERLKNQAP